MKKGSERAYTVPKKYRQVVCTATVQMRRRLIPTLRCVLVPACKADREQFLASSAGPQLRYAGMGCCVAAGEKGGAKDGAAVNRAGGGGRTTTRPSIEYLIHSVMQSHVGLRGENGTLAEVPCLGLTEWSRVDTEASTQAVFLPLTCPRGERKERGWDFVFLHSHRGG